jgi:hypothetical protein
MFWSIFVQSSLFIATVVLLGGAVDWFRDRDGRGPR